MAAGLTIAEDKLADFAAFLDERLTAAVARSNADRALLVDALLAPGGVTPLLCETMDGGGPYGMGWPAPRVVAGPFRAIKVDIVGNGHVRAIMAGDDGRSLKAMAFRSAPTPRSAKRCCRRRRTVNCGSPAVPRSTTGDRARRRNCISTTPPGRIDGREQMFSHITLGTNDPDRARQFYEPVMATLGVGQPFILPHALVFGDMMGTKLFVGPPFDGGGASNGNGTHAAFLAPDRAAVDAFHAAALANGGSDEGRSGPAPALPSALLRRLCPRSRWQQAASRLPPRARRRGLTIRAALPNRLAAPAMAPSSSG